MNFLRDLKLWKNNAEKFADKNSPSKFAEKFAGNFPKFARPKKQIHPKSTLQNLELNLLRRGHLKIGFHCHLAHHMSSPVLLPKAIPPRKRRLPFFRHLCISWNCLGHVQSDSVPCRLLPNSCLLNPDRGPKSNRTSRLFPGSF